jgi:exopolysaccharide biosynthesis operon protein EpsL
VVLLSRRFSHYACLLFVLPLSTRVLAAADPGDHLQLFAMNTMAYDDNLFRLSDRPDADRVLQPGMARSDFVNQLSAGGRFNFPWQRQQFIADVRVDDNRYANNDFLNNVSTNNKLTWKWQLGSRWSGNLGYHYAQALASFAYTRPIVKDMVSDHNAFFDVGYTWHPRWKTQAGFRWQDANHSNPLRAFVDQETAVGLFGLTYTTPANNSLGLDYRYTSVFLPNRDLSPETLVDNRFQVNTGAAAFVWHLTAKTELDGRFGYSSLANRNYGQRDFDGPTWRISLHWAATEKTRVSLETWRDLQPSQIIDASYMVAEGAGLSSVWNATAKLRVNAKVSFENLTFEGNPGLSGSGGDRVDELWLGRIGVAYLPVRNLELGLAYQGEKRDSNRPINDFIDNSVFGSVRLFF